jgi:hypothetical protein
MSGSGETIETLFARIESLERTVAIQNTLIQQAQLSPPQSRQNSPHLDKRQTVESNNDIRDDTNVRQPIGQDIQEAAIALAQMSLGNHHGEYFGRGTVLSALHEV